MFYPVVRHRHLFCVFIGKIANMDTSSPSRNKKDVEIMLSVKKITENRQGNPREQYLYGLISFQFSDFLTDSK